MAPSMMSSRDLTQEQQRNAGTTEATVRLSIGLEDLGDLTEDVNQALAVSAPST
jgi:cystathionine beta-lyase/cystathionine gamma-synthase